MQKCNEAITVYSCLNVYLFLVKQSNLYKFSNETLIYAFVYTKDENDKQEINERMAENTKNYNDYQLAIRLYEVVLETQGLLDIIKKLSV